MSKFRRIISAILLPITIAYLVYMPRVLNEALGREYYREWLEPGGEEFSGTIIVWHVVGFKPYIGSLGSWMGRQASHIEKEHFGVYFEVTSMTEDEAMSLLSEGKRPDVFSVPLGWCSEDGIRELDTPEEKIDVSSGLDNAKLKAIPYAASGMLLLYDPVKLNPALDGLEGLNPGTIEDFKIRKTDCCTADVRAAGDLYRAALSGKAEPFDAVPYSDETSLVQYLCVNSDVDPGKLPYIHALIERVVSAQSQESLCELGLMPMNLDVKLEYEQPFLNELFERLRGNPTGIPNTFDFWHSRDI